MGMLKSSVSLAKQSSVSHLRCCSALLDIPGMKDPLVVALTRLIEREGGRANVADEIKSSDQTLYQIIKGVKDSKSGTPKGVGPSLRKRLDERYPGWRLLGDQPRHEWSHIAPTRDVVAQKSENLILIPERSVGNTFKHAPVVAWACLGDVLNRDNDDWPIEAMREIHSTKPVSRKVKWLEVQDDLLAPKVLKGDLVAVDPEGSPKMDSLVLALAADDSYMLRFWRPLAAGAFELFDSAGRTMDSDRHGVRVVATFVTLQRDSL